MFNIIKTLLPSEAESLASELATEVSARNLLPPGDDTTPLYRECLDAR